VFSTQYQVDAIYFSFSSAFGTLSRTLLSSKIISFGLTSAYFSGFLSYETDFCVLIFLVFSALLDFFPVFLEVPIRVFAF
jgi:hypothetical protein